ncbi:rhomboid family intramembrane serine protease, partial [bacterium]|nr:rhomboid family intramembrane serine protease [bacterium]
NWGGWGGRGATPWLVGITVAVWFGQLLTRDARGGGLTEWAVYDPRLILDGQVWRLLTSVFLHSERQLLHIVFNMIVLWWAGRQLEDRYGPKEFVAFYLTAGVFANLVNLAAQVAGLAPWVSVLGASGAVTATLVVFAFLYPRQQILVMFVIPMPIWAAVVLYVVLDVLGALGGRVGNEPVAYVVHLGGALFGAIYYLGNLRLTSFLPPGGSFGRNKARSQPRLRVVPSDDADENSDTEEPPAPRPPEERFDERVDRLLEKVSRHGQESLTPEERELLFRAGEHYKKRRR